MITAEKVYKTILNMPVGEREKLFSVIARKGFEKDSYVHEEVFGDIRETPFTLREAAQYLEVAEITMRRWVGAGTIHHRKVGKNITFDPDELKRFKRSRVKKR